LISYYSHMERKRRARGGIGFLQSAGKGLSSCIVSGSGIRHSSAADRHCRAFLLEVPMKRSDMEITNRSLIDEIIRCCEVCHLAMASGDEPYVVPMSFGYDGTSVYFHTASKGKKIDFITANPRVCIQFERGVRLVSSEADASKCTFSFESVIGFGVMEELSDPESKAYGLNQIMQHYTGREWRFDTPVFARTRVWRVYLETLTGKRSSAKPT
jgi:nitroimidazol reductase NimA-like FMN-containing flavoprotein (pyridoxamine 5'-phosphate oxidase superfamily)